MSCSPLLARKKRNLYPDHCRPRHTLCLELGCGARTNHRSLASLPGASAASQTILLGCLSGLRQSLLWCSLRNAHRQTGDLFAGSCECRSPSLSQAPGSQIAMLHPTNAFPSKKPATLRLLLQPPPISQTPVSQILFSSH
jgi:hypothetical protein